MNWRRLSRVSSPERERLVLEKGFLEAVQDKSTKRIDATFKAASEYKAKEDAKVLVGLR